MRDDVGDRDLEVAEGEVERDQHAQHDQADDRDDRPARTGTSHDAAPTRTAGWRCTWPIRTVAHIRTIRVRRTRAMKTGPPISAITMPTCSSAGPHDDAADDVGDERAGAPPISAEYGITQR